MELAREITLIAAIIAMALFAGVFYTFSSLVMIGLRRTDDRTFVSAMQKINAAPGFKFAIAIIGPGVFTFVTLVLHLSSGDRSALWWVVAALVLYTLAIGVVTFAGNVPLHNALAAAGDPDRIADLAAVQASFEADWIRWNNTRAAVSVGALTCLTLALTITAIG